MQNLSSAILVSSRRMHNLFFFLQILEVINFCLWYQQQKKNQVEGWVDPVFFNFDMSIIPLLLRSYACAIFLMVSPNVDNSCLPYIRNTTYIRDSCCNLRSKRRTRYVSSTVRPESPLLVRHAAVPENRAVLSVRLSVAPPTHTSHGPWCTIHVGTSWRCLAATLDLFNFITKRYRISGFATTKYLISGLAWNSRIATHALVDGA